MTILMCAQKLTDASLIYHTVAKTKTSKMKKLKSKRICSEETVPGKKPWSQSGRGKEVWGRNDLWNRKVLRVNHRVASRVYRLGLVFKVKSEEDYMARDSGTIKILG